MAAQKKLNEGQLKDQHRRWQDQLVERIREIEFDYGLTAEQILAQVHSGAIIEQDRHVMLWMDYELLDKYGHERLREKRRDERQFIHDTSSDRT